MKSQKILGVLTVTPMAVVQKKGRNLAIPVGPEHLVGPVEIKRDPIRQELIIASESGGKVTVGYSAAYADHFAKVFGDDPHQN